MTRRLNKAKWLEIKTRYQMGDAIRAIARDYNISDGTIHHRIKKENWTQELSAQLFEIQQRIKNIEQQIEPSQIPIVEARLSEILQLEKAVNSFIKGAININLRNLKELNNEPDLKTRIVGMSQMKATMADVVAFSNIKPKFEDSKLGQPQILEVRLVGND